MTYHDKSLEICPVESKMHFKNAFFLNAEKMHFYMHFNMRFNTRDMS